ncbi:MAG TPA: hypothetical protein VKB30_02590 [Candidatus Limnocylindrales bacterium]|nr:hypothetical protein [Candidatus Limnocylindrales bacterium]
MRGCLFTLVLGAVVIALIVVVGLPQVAAGMVTTAVAAAGLEADDTTVTVSSDPPTDLIGLRADRVRIRATDATFRDLAIGALDVELRDVSILDRTADAVAGRLSDVTVANVGGSAVILDRISVGGGGDDVTATTVIGGSQAELLISDAVEQRTGVRPNSVTLQDPDRLTIDVGVEVAGTLDVAANGDLVLEVDDNPVGLDEVVLLRAGDDLPIRLRDVLVTPGGDLQLDGDLAIGLLG